jgi:mannosyltransferase OCH1-like enzyme
VGKSHWSGINQFRDQNPDIDFCLFDTIDRDAYMHAAWKSHPIWQIYRDSLFGPMSADLFRYCILWERGGFYLDIKSRFLAPMASLLDQDTKGLISYENRYSNVPGPKLLLERLQHPTRLALQWGMAFAPGHPFLKRLIDNIVAYESAYRDVVFADPQAAICRFTGPGMFTMTLREHVALSPDFDIKQLGVDFDGRAEYDMPGAWSRWALCKHYSLARSRPILARRPEDFEPSLTMADSTQ